MKFRQLMRATENKYNRLLANLVLLYIIYPFLVYLPLGDLLVFFFFSLSVIIAVYQIDRSKLALRCNIGLFLIALILRVFGTIIPIYRDLTGWFDLSSTLISLAFISLCVYSILQPTFRTLAVEIKSCSSPCIVRLLAITKNYEVSHSSQRSPA